MSSVWTIKCNQGSVSTKTEFSALDLGNLTRRRVNQAPDEVTFDGPAAFDGAQLFPYNSTCRIYKDGVLWFLGVCKTVPRVGEAESESIAYHLLGPWYWLQRTFEQTRMAWDVGTAAFVATYVPRAVLGQAADGSRYNTGEQIEEIVDYAIMRGAPITKGTIDVDVVGVWEEVTTITCADAITMMLRYTPDASCYFDYSTDPPTFHVRKFANRSAQAYAVGTDPLAAVPTVTPRYDLQVPGVKVVFQIRSTVSGLPGGDQVVESLVQQTAGSYNDVEAVAVCMELAGQHTQYTSQKITTEDLPVSLADKAFWKATLPELLPINDADMAIANVVTDPTPLDPALPRVLRAGTIQDWMTDSAGDPIEHEEVTVYADMTINKRALIGNQVGKVTTRKLTAKLRITNAESRIYRRFEYADMAEPIPPDLATDLYNAWSKLWFDGRIVLIEDECSQAIHAGHVINITGGLAEWASMASPVQAIIEHVDNGTTTVECGYPGQLGRDNKRDLHRRLRRRRIPTTHRSRITGDPGDDAGANDNNDADPLDGGGYLDEDDESQIYTKYDAGGNPSVQIEVDPADTDWEEHRIMIAQDNAGVLEIRPGWLRAHT